MKSDDLNHCFDTIGPTDQQQAMLWERLNQSRAHKNSARWRHGLAVAVIAVCFILTTAVAAYHFGLDEKLRSFLQIENPAQAEQLASGAYQVDKRISNRNGTLEINQVVGDGNHIYLTMDFTAPEGTALEAARYRFDSSFPDITNYAGSYSYGFTKMEDTDPADNHIALIMTITIQSAVAGETLRLDFRDLEAAGPFPSTFEPALSGRWKVTVPLKFQDCAVSQTLNTPFSVQGYYLTLQKFSISPLSVTFQAGGSNTRDALYAAKAATEGQYVFPVTLQLRDGDALTLEAENAGMTYEVSQRDIFLTFTFNQVIDVEAVRSVSFCDIEIPVK